MEQRALLEPGLTCWRKARTRRFAMLVDACEYYAALADALENAQSEIVILAWDFDTRTPLRRKGDAVESFSDIAHRVLRANPDLTLTVLCWHFHPVYALDREKHPERAFAADVSSRVRYVRDDRCPPRGSHHQKIVVIDCKIAFQGGLDIGQGRWDTRGHLPDDARRVRHDGKPYIPYHDCMALVDGPLSVTLRDLFRLRWKSATGDEIPEAEERTNDPWPASVPSVAEDLVFGVSRTDPGCKGDPRVTEIEALLLRLIASARKTLYMETQYFSSQLLACAIAQRLEEPEGPEVLIVVPKRFGGFVERHTVGARQARLIRWLQARDPHGRFRAVSPMSDLWAKKHIHVHAKIVAVDDDAFCVGSANCNARSLGYDTEVGLTLVAAEHANDGKTAELAARRTITLLRDDLIREHLGLDLAVWQDLLARKGSVLRAVEAAPRQARTVVMATNHTSTAGVVLAAFVNYVDPKRPHLYGEPPPTEELLPNPERPRTARSARSSALALVSLLALLCSLVLVWRFTPLSQWLDVERVSTLARSVWEMPLGPLAIVGAIFLLATFMFPMSLLTAAAAVTLEPIPAILTSFLGAMLSGLFMYAVGRAVGAQAVESLLGERFRKIRLIERLRQTTLLPVIVFRLLPVAPYTLLNIAFGAGRIPFGIYALGTAIALLPGKIAAVFFATQIKAMLLAPERYLRMPLLWISCALGVLICVLTMCWLKRKAARTPLDAPHPPAPQSSRPSFRRP